MQTDTIRNPSGSTCISEALLAVLKPPMCASGKPLCIKRRPGRPRKDGASPTKTSKPILKVKRFTSGRFLTTNCRGIRGRRKRDAVLLSHRGNSASGANELGQIGNESPSKAEDTAESDSSSVASSLEKLHEDYVLFPEQWPGKVCAFCNLGERSLLGQGELLRLKIPLDFDPLIVSKSIAKFEKENLNDLNIKTAASQRRLKGIGKMKRLTSQSSLESLSEPFEEFIGFAEEPDPNTLFDMASGFYYIHTSCARWCKNGNQDTDGRFIDLEVQILRAASQRCNHCGNFGAGVECKNIPCGAFLHFPCTATSGAYQDRSTFSTLCISHLDAVISNGMTHSCTVCNSTASYSSMLMCCSCGHHYHHTCMALNPDPSIRAGWQCPACKVCQACRQPGEENKLLSCDTCDKAYHVFCLRPALVSIPKHSWKCKMCRVCSDCGARTPGSGPSSRWHANFSVCDSCYQQRNKGLACPLCGKAYRHVAQKLMIQCHVCKKFVHGSCDPNAELSVYQQKKQTCPDYDYACLHCTSGGPILPIVRGFLQLRKSSDMLELEAGGILPQPHDGLGYVEDEMMPAADLSSDLSNAIKKRVYMEGSGSAVHLTGKTIRKKSGAGRPRNSDLLSLSSRRPCFSEVGHKRGPKPKLRGNYGMSGSQRPSSESQEEEPGVENRLVLCSSKDDFVLQQDVCVMCGAFGNDSEGRLIACAQCGQCYHPFCVNVSVTKVVLQKGWRCLDCTVCEGCGQRHDEARLILCDDCDISFHIYCINPPLDYVPQGNWKCKWCTVCQMCGSSDPGINSFWQHNYSMCGPCTSLTTCPTCNIDYNDSELIVHCIECDRWMHSSCDDITTEEDAEKCMEIGYKCRSCRPRDTLPPHMVPSPKPLVEESPPRSPDNSKMRLSAQFTMDGVCLSDHGIHHVRARLIEQPRKKRKKINNIADMEAGILAAIETVVSGSSLEVSDTIGVDRLGDASEKDREGKKRQRNLQKVGIGGFLVRLRGSRFKDDEFESVTDMSGSIGESEKPKKKSPRRKIKNKLIESFPVYLQEAFFGKALLEPIRNCDIPTADDNDSDSVTPMTHDNKLNLTKDQMIILDSITSDIRHDTGANTINKVLGGCAHSVTKYIDIKGIKIEDENTEVRSTFVSEGTLGFPSPTGVGNNTNLKLKQEPLSGADLCGDELGEIHPVLSIGSHKDDISNFLNSGFALESVGPGLPSMDSMDVEDVFKVVHTEESSQESEDTQSLYKDKQMNSHAILNYQPTIISSTSNSPNLSSGNTTPMSTPVVQGSPGITRSTSLPPNAQQGLTSPVNFPPPSPYHSEYSNSPQFSPAFSEPPSPWPTQIEPDVDPPSTYNQRSLLKWEADEVLGNSATISAVLYANINHPELKRDYLAWNERSKQIAKIWRSLSAEKRAPYLQKARENRAASRMQKVQQDQDKLLTTGPVKTATRAETPEERHWKQMQVLRQQQAQQQQQMLQDHRAQGEPRQELVGTPSPVPSPKHQYSPIQVQRQLSVEPNSGKEGSKQILQVSTSLEQTLSPQMPSPASHQGYSKSRPILGIVGHRPISQSSEMPPPNPSGHYSLRPNLVSSSPLTSRPALYSRLPFGTSTRPQMPSPTSVFSSNPAVGMEHFVRSNSPINRPQSDIEVYSPNSESFHVKPVDFISGGISGTGPDDDTMLTSSKNSALPGNETRQHLRELLQRQQNKKRLDTDPLASPALQKSTHWSREDWQNSSVRDGATGDSYNRGVHTVIAGSTSPSLQTTQHIPQQGRFRFLSPQVRMGLVATAAPGLSAVPISSSGSQENASQQIVSGPSDTIMKVDTQKSLRQSISAGNVIPFDSTDPSIPSDIPVASSMLAQQLVRPVAVSLNLNSRSSPSFPRKRAPVGVPNSATSLSSIASDSGSLNSSDHQELPESVTEELEKLEQEQHNDTEPETADLVDLGVDDDELLGMGADFNILEYADPELDQAVGGEKTNILDNLDLEEEKEDEKELSKHIKGKEEKENDRNESARVDSKSVASLDAGNLHETSKLDAESSAASLPSDTFKQPTITAESTVGLLRPQPPPPYPGPPPPYPGRMPLIGSRICNDKLLQPVSRLTNMSLVIPSSSNTDEVESHLIIPSALPVTTISTSGSPILSLHQRRTLLLQEQPLLLAELLEQEKREQQKQGPTFSGRVESPAEERLLSDFDFERLKADVLQSGGTTANVKNIMPSQSILFAPGTSGKPTLEHVTSEWAGDLVSSQKNSDSSHSESAVPKHSLFSVSPMFGNDTASRFRNSVSSLPPPPQPPEYPVTEQERQMQVQYEQWLYHQQHILSLQLQFFDQEVTKLRKGKKSMKSKQRQLRKNSSELSESGTAELEKITRELTVLQKQLEQSRKQSRQHGVIVQEYRTKQQKLQILGNHQTGIPTQVSLPAKVSPSTPVIPALVSPVQTVSTPLLSPSNSVIGH